MFELKIGEYDGKRKVIYLIGEIDIYSAPDFKDSLYGAIGDCKEDVVLECSELTYIDSMGLGIMVAVLKRIRQNECNVYINGVKPNVRKLFKITGLDKAFIMEESK
jgi:anti-sigma B factor antagonist